MAAGPKKTTVNDVPNILERLYYEAQDSSVLKFPFEGLRGDETFDRILHKLGRDQL